MPKSDAFDHDLLLLIFNGTPIANLADNAASSPLTNLYLSLHIADPGGAGDQTTNECAYTSYGRVAIVRTSSGWTVTGSDVSPVSPIVFPAWTGGSTASATHAAVGTAPSGAGKILYRGTVSPNIPIGAGTPAPTLPTTSVITEA
jgi:hypothetical protein